MSTTPVFGGGNYLEGMKVLKEVWGMRSGRRRWRRRRRRRRKRRRDI